MAGLLDGRRFALAAFMTVAGAGLVCLLKVRPLELTVLLAGLLAANIARRWLKRRRTGEAFGHVFVVVTSAVIGYLTESWGTTNAYWTYHFLPPGQHVPLWVPLAWAIAGELLHFVEAPPKTFPTSPALALAVAYATGMFFPLLGEAIAVANGVWTYYWPYQILGIPLAALLLIAYAHLAFGAIRAGVATKFPARA